MRYLLALLLLVSCGQESSEVIIYDTVSVEAFSREKFYDSVAVLIPQADKKIKQREKAIIKKIDKLEVVSDSLKKENEQLKEVVRVTKSIIIRDTVYITEKKNFWGKTKVTTDSSQGVVIDSLENQ
jgi:hypothetical protein